MTKDRVLEYLEANKDSFISGEDIASNLNVSRNSVWKAVIKLKEEGYPIDSQTKLGYKLSSTSKLLSQTEISSLLDNKNHNVIVLKEIDSTNNYIKMNPQLEDLTVVISDYQTGGRGRLGRSFFSPANSSIYLSLLIKNPDRYYDVSMLTVTAAVALFEAVKPFTTSDLKIKWVNDLFLNDKKLAGILTESETEMETKTFRHAIIGIGINVLNESFPKDLEDIATSIFIEDKKNVNRNQLASSIINSLDKNLDILKNSTTEIIKKYNDNLIFKNEVITFRNFNETFNATFKGINESGNIILLVNGEEKTYISGEILTKHKKNNL